MTESAETKQRKVNVNQFGASVDNEVVPVTGQPFFCIFTLHQHLSTGEI